MKLRYRAGAVASCLLLFAAFAGRTDATTLKRMDLPELVSTAERVVHARVTGGHSYWDESRTQIFTDTEFEVLAEAKGEGSRRITITLMGGTVGIIDMIVPGTPVFEIDDEAVLFTEPRADGRQHLVGLSQGAMRIVRDPETGDRIAVSEVHGGVSYVVPEKGALRPVRAAAQRAPLKALLDAVREMARDGRSDRMFSDTPETPTRRPAGRVPR